jgi:hypothetical protein
MIWFMTVSEDLKSALGGSVLSNGRSLLAGLSCHIEALPVSSPSTHQALIQWPPSAGPFTPRNENHAPTAAQPKHRTRNKGIRPGQGNRILTSRLGTCQGPRAKINGQEQESDQRHLCGRVDWVKWGKSHYAEYSREAAETRDATLRPHGSGTAKGLGEGRNRNNAHFAP